MLEIILIVAILIVNLAILYAVKNGFNQLIKGMEAIDKKLIDQYKKKEA